MHTLILEREKEFMELRLWILFGAIFLSGKGYLGLNIEECSNGRRSVTEYTNVSLKCGRCIELTDWFIGDDKDQLKTYIGNCTRTKCTLQNMLDFRLSVNQRNTNYDSVLDIISIPRGDDLIVSCKCYCYSYYYKQYMSDCSDLCRLRIQVPVSIVSNSCKVQLSQWKVFGVCTVQWLDNPVCRWSLTYKDSTRELNVSQDPTVYVPQDDSYTRGNCSFELNMPTDEGNYTFNISVSSHPADQFSKTFPVERPEQPKHNCPEIVLEGSDLNCTCYASKMGNPPAQIQWNNEKLTFENVQRKSSGTNVTCHLLWAGITKTTVYTIRVAYGPSSVLLNSSTGIGSDTIRFTCTAIDVYPSAVFTWNISCHNQTDNINISTCILNLTKQDEHLLVTCTARNTHFPSVVISKTIAQPIVRDEVLDAAASTGSISGGVIGGAIAAAVIALVIVAVVLVCIIKHRKGITKEERGSPGVLSDGSRMFHVNTPLSKLYAVVKKPKTQTPIERHSAPSGDLYTIPSSATTEHSEDEYASVYEEADNKAFKADNICDHQEKQVSEATKEWTATEQSTVKPAAVVETFQDMSGVYMNVTEFPNDSGLGVYHVVPSASLSGPVNSDSSTKDTSEEEYNALHFGDDQAGQDDAAADYNHLQITENNYFILELAQ